MVHPSLLFVYEGVVVGEKMHARCVCCSDNSAFDWPASNLIVGFVLPDGPRVSVAQSVSDVIPSPVPAGAEGVYSAEAFLDDVPSWARCMVMMMRNSTIVIISGLDRRVALPFFLSADSLTTPIVRTATVRLHVENVADLPDARLYLDKSEKYRSGASGDKWDRMFYDPREGRERVAIPIDAYLPCTIEAAGREYQAVYRINEYVDADRASLRVHMADQSTPFGVGTVLRRRRREAGFNIAPKDVATIEAVPD